MIRKVFIKLFFIFLLFNEANSVIEVDITRGNLNPLPVAVSPLFSDENTNKNLKNNFEIIKLGEKISEVVENNLKTTGLFNPIEKKAFLQKPDVAHLKPRFEDWALIKSQALVTGQIKLENEKLRVEFRLWDVLAGKN